MDISRHLRHAITWWKASSGPYGEPVFEAPQSLEGRWSDVAEQFYDLQGRETVSRAKVTVATDIEPGDFLYWGDSIIADPRTVPGAHEVRQFKKKANLRNTTFLREAML